MKFPAANTQYWNPLFQHCINHIQYTIDSIYRSHVLSGHLCTCNNNGNSSCGMASSLLDRYVMPTSSGNLKGVANCSPYNSYWHISPVNSNSRMLLNLAWLSSLACQTLSSIGHLHHSVVERVQRARLWLCLSYTHVCILCDSTSDYVHGGLCGIAATNVRTYICSVYGLFAGFNGLDFEICTTLALLLMGSCEHKLDKVCEYTNEVLY